MKTLAALLFLTLALLANAQGHNPNPVPELQKIAFLEGHWVGTQNFNTDGPPMSMQAANDIHSAIGGRYLEETLATTLPGPDHKRSDSRHFLTFDPAEGLYKAWWFNDSSKGGPMELEGKLIDGKLVLESLQSPGKKGSPVFRATYKAESTDKLTYSLELKTGETWRPLFRTEYKRMR